jgi:hypothetical protein
MTQANDQPTCGKGLAEHSTLPAKLADLIAALAEILEQHQAALDPTDPSARQELHAYIKLAQEFRGIATQLKTTAEHMAAYRNLPMGRHDPQIMSGPGQGEAFARYVSLEQELHQLLQRALERDRAMLESMHRSA